jgi:hypothetical protein
MGPESDRSAFAERLRNQIAARYRATTVVVDEERFTVHVVAPGIDTHLALAPLFHACEREPGNTPELIARFVSSVERQLTPQTEAEPLLLNQQVWCVRSRHYLRDLTRSDELLQRPLGGELIAFVAEMLPGQVMRGVPASRWRSRGMDDEAIIAAADAATAQRFGRIAERIRQAPRIPADGWRLSVDQLFSGSLLLIPDVLAALVERAGSPVLLANPDRSVVIAVPSTLRAAESFAMRALREWREAVNPSAADVYLTDGSGLQHQPRHSRVRSKLMPWLAE